MKKQIALIIGATGATGRDLTKLLVRDPDFKEVRIFVRKAGSFRPAEKLDEHVVDFDRMDEWKELLKGGDVVFSCLGTTRKDAGNKKEQEKVDKGYQLNFARNAAEQGVEQLVLISSRGASVNSPFFYAKMKGEIDKAVCKMNFRRIFILRPNSLIRKGSERKGESVSVNILKSLNRIGLFKGYRPIETKTLAQRMIALSKSEAGNGVIILEGNDI